MSVRDSTNLQLLRFAKMMSVANILIQAIIVMQSAENQGLRKPDALAEYDACGRWPERSLGLVSGCQGLRPNEVVRDCSSRQALIFALASINVRNQFAFKHSSRSRPFKLSTWPFCIVLTG